MYPLENHLAKLSTLGTGLLLGAALGVIIPEYVPAILNFSRSYGDSTNGVVEE